MNKKLHIGIFVDAFFPVVDGVVRCVDNYARELLEFADVTVITTGDPTKKYVDDFPYEVLRSKCFSVKIIDYSVPVISNNLRKVVKQKNFDIVFVHSPFFIGKMGTKYAQKHKVPCVGVMHSQFKKDFKKATKSEFLSNRMIKYVMRVFNKCDENWAVNGAIADVFSNYGALEHPGVICNGTDLLPITDKEKACQDVNEMYNIDKDDRVLLYCGRLDVLKNILYIAEVAKILKDKGQKFKLLYVGSGIDTQQLVDKIDELELNDCVTLCGIVTDRETLAKIYCRADLQLFPSYYDASSLVQIEAASQHTPTLFLENSATTDTVTKNVNGFIVADDQNIYADKIIEILNDDELLSRVANGAFRDLYITWHDCAKIVYDRFEFLLKHNPKLVDKKVQKARRKELKLAQKQRKQENKAMLKEQKAEK